MSDHANDDTQAELQKWFWHDCVYDEVAHADFTDGKTSNANHIGAAMAGLGLSPHPKSQGGDNTCYSIEHFDNTKDSVDTPRCEGDQQYVADGFRMLATGAHARFAVNQVGGAIFAQALESPKAAAEVNWQLGDDDLGELLSDLRTMSDIMFAYWLWNNPSPKSLRYYFANNVQNTETLQVIVRILEEKERNDLSYWPGLKVEMWEDSAPALVGTFGKAKIYLYLINTWLPIGSPIGATIAFMLVQHKAELGTKHITPITIFRDSHEGLREGLLPQVQPVFAIENVPVPDDDMGDGHSSRVRRRVDVSNGGKNVLRVLEHHVDEDMMRKFRLAKL